MARLNPALLALTASGAVMFAGACSDSTPLDVEPQLALGGAGRPVVTVNQHAKGGAPNTIQAGVDLVAEGGRVQVLPGVYTDPVVIEKDVTIETVGDGEVILRPPDEYVAINIVGHNTVSIVGLTIDHLGSTHANPLAIGTSRSVDLVVDDVTMLGSFVGVYAWNDHGDTQGRGTVRVTNSYVDGGPDLRTFVGIWIGGANDGHTEGNTVRNVDGPACIWHHWDVNGDVLGNTVENCHGWAIRGNVGDDNWATVIGNTVTADPAIGDEFGIIWTYGSGTIAHNVVAGYDLGAIALGRAASFDINFNDIGDNVTGFTAHPDAGPADLTCNWWGASDGPSVYNDGSGSQHLPPPDRVEDYLIVPWATAPIAGTGATGCAGGL